jgi:D-alanyl-D-alanine carboxypeptidase
MVQKVNNKRHRKRVWRNLLISVFLLFLFGKTAIQNDTFGSLIENTIGNSNNVHIIESSEDWNLIVVNRWNEMPENYDVALTLLSNGQSVDSRVYPYLQEMFNDAREDGIYPIVREGYRSQEEQQEQFDEKMDAYMKEGYSKTRAKKITEEWVALPGTSEHQLGIAVDINADKAKCSNDEVYAWLSENAHKYGFILRYPQGKRDITGTNYEPWHFRYVGADAAKEIYEQGICLEEYVKP